MCSIAILFCFAIVSSCFLICSLNFFANLGKSKTRMLLVIKYECIAWEYPHRSRVPLMIMRSIQLIAPSILLEYFFRNSVFIYLYYKISYKNNKTFWFWLLGIKSYELRVMNYELRITN